MHGTGIFICGNKIFSDNEGSGKHKALCFSVSFVLFVDRA